MSRSVRHYLEMLVAMAVGMVTLYPLWLLAVAALGLDAASWVGAVETESLVMATTMTVPMAAWMLHRGHRWAPTLEMSAAMYAGFAVLLPFAWAGLLDRGAVLELGHVLMLVFMLVAVLARRHEHACGDRGRSRGRRQQRDEPSPGALREEVVQPQQQVREGADASSSRPAGRSSEDRRAGGPSAGVLGPSSGSGMADRPM